MKDMLREIKLLQWKWLVCRGIEQPPDVDCFRSDATVDTDVSLHTYGAGSVKHRLNTLDLLY